MRHFPNMTLDDFEAGELAIMALAGKPSTGYKMPNTLKRGKIESLLLWIMSNEPPYDCWDMLDAGVVYPVLWLQNRYPDLPSSHLKCPMPALQAFARRHPGVVYGNASWPVPHPFAVELAAYLDSLAAGAAIDAVLESVQ